MTKRIEDIIPGTSWEIKKGRRVQFTALPGHRTLLYVAKGTITVNGETVPACHLIVFEQANEEIIVAATTAAQILFLSPEPIDHPIAGSQRLLHPGCDQPFSAGQCPVKSLLLPDNQSGSG